MLHVPNYFKLVSKRWCRLLAKQITFPTSCPIIVHGVNVREPQDVQLFGDSNTMGLAYGPLKREPLPMPPILLHICQVLELFCAKLLGSHLPEHADLNLVLVNRYLNGQDSMGPHADTESGLGLIPFIVSLSLGSACWFQFKHKITKEVKKIFLDDGSLIIMVGWDIQKNWKHGLPKTKKPCKERWNLSYRYHKQKQ